MSVEIAQVFRCLRLVSIVFVFLDGFRYPSLERDEVYVEIFEQAEKLKKNRLNL